MSEIDYDACQKTEPDTGCFKCPRMKPRYAYCARLDRLEKEKPEIE